MPPRIPDRPPEFYVSVPAPRRDSSGAEPLRANIVKIHDLHPGMTRRFYDMYRMLMMQEGPITRDRREMIAVAVSSANDCHY
jgi:hypothetical protein